MILVSATAEEAPSALARALPRTGASHLGAGAVERDGKVWVVVLLSERRARIEPFPREVAAGARAVLSGALSSSARPPPRLRHAAVGRGRGGWAAAPARSFRVPLEFDAPGRHVVEIVGEGDGGPEVAAVLTVAAGGALARRAGAGRSRPSPPISRRARPGSSRALNATRRRHGLPAVSASPEIAAVARRHAEAMAASGRVAHVVPGSRDAAERLRRAGVPYRRAYENVARAGTALDAHAAAEESPAHLANVLRPDATRAGVGVARARLPSGDPTVYLTELLVEPPDDGAASRLTPDARVREALWRERARLRLAPLTRGPRARRARPRRGGRDARRGTRPSRTGSPTGRSPSGATLAAVDVFVASGPEEATRSANLRDARFARVGVGLASGDSARFGKGRLWIAVVYTD